jgi:hypothetical protein
MICIKHALAPQPVMRTVGNITANWHPKKANILTATFTMPYAVRLQPISLKAGMTSQDPLGHWDVKTTMVAGTKGKEHPTILKCKHTAE